jgi:hypothetical protein
MGLTIEEVDKLTGPVIGRVSQLHRDGGIVGFRTL